MEIQELEIIIDSNGITTIHVNGVKGSGCETLTKNLESRIGDVKEKNLTPEHFEESNEVRVEETRTR